MNYHGVIVAFRLVLLSCTPLVSAGCKSCLHSWTDNSDVNQQLENTGLFDSKCKDNPSEVTSASCSFYEDECYTIIVKYTMNKGLGYNYQHIVMRGCGRLHAGENSCEQGTAFGDSIKEQIDTISASFGEYIKDVQTGECSCTGSSCNTISFTDAVKQMSKLSDSSSSGNSGSNNSQPRSATVSFLLITMTTVAMVFNKAFK